MQILITLIHILLPLIALTLLIYGIKSTRTIFVSAALWLSLLTVLLHYQISGSELLGSYFDYTNAAIYSVNILIMLIAVVYLLSLSKMKNSFLGALNNLLKAALVIGCFIVITNLWINAYFIEMRMPGTPVMQVVTMQPTDYCKHRYIFYKIAKNGSVHYLCPNQYGVFPGIGMLSTAPEYILRQLPQSVLKKIVKQQQRT